MRCILLCYKVIIVTYGLLLLTHPRPEYGYATPSPPAPPLPFKRACLADLVLFPSDLIVPLFAGKRGTNIQGGNDS
jgi:hypothetical protein